MEVQRWCKCLRDAATPGTRFLRKEERKKKCPPLFSYSSKPIIAPTGELVQKAREIPGEVCSNRGPRQRARGWVGAELKCVTDSPGELLGIGALS